MRWNNKIYEIINVDLRLSFNWGTVDWSERTDDMKHVIWIIWISIFDKDFSFLLRLKRDLVSCQSVDFKLNVKVSEKKCELLYHILSFMLPCIHWRKENIKEFTCVINVSFKKLPKLNIFFNEDRWPSNLGWLSTI